MLASMGLEAFLGWLDYYQRHPWGEHRADARNAVLIDHLLAPHYRDYRPSLSVLWPYADLDRDPARSAKWVDEFSQSLVPKPG